MNTLAFTVCFAAWMMNGVLITFLNPVSVAALPGGLEPAGSSREEGKGVTPMWEYTWSTGVGLCPFTLTI